MGVFISGIFVSAWFFGVGDFFREVFGADGEGDVEIVSVDRRVGYFIIRIMGWFFERDVGLIEEISKVFLIVLLFIMWVRLNVFLLDNN